MRGSLQEETKSRASGFLSLGRLNDMNSLDSDLSAPLIRSSTSAITQAVVPRIQMIPVVPGSSENVASKVRLPAYICTIY